MVKSKLNSDEPGHSNPGKTKKREPTAAAKRALSEAVDRRKVKQTSFQNETGPKEINGRNGPEPVRFGDWEVKGIASDF